MSAKLRCPLLPFLGACVLALLPLLHAGCGTGEGGGRRYVELVGGALKPNPVAYRLTPPSEAVLPDLRGAEVPSRVDLREDGIIPPVQNQRWNSCVGWSLGYFVMSAVQARHLRNLGYHPDMSDAENWFSPDFLYSQRDELEHRETFPHLKGEPICFEPDGEIGCMRPERALDALMRHGIARWTWMCARGSSAPLRACGDVESYDATATSRPVWQLGETNAGWYRPRCYVRFGKLGDEEKDLRERALGSMQRWLSQQGTPIALVAKMSSGWVTYAGQNTVTVRREREDGSPIVEQRSVCLDAGGLDLGSSHMMTIIGYDDDFPSQEEIPGLPPSHKGSVLIVNQWGTKWGDQGTMWLPYAELQRIWVGAYGLIRGDGEVNKDRPECAQDDSGRWFAPLEADDVPENLKADGSYVPTAKPLGAKEADETGTTVWIESDRVGQREQLKDANNQPSGPFYRDQADWWSFEVDGPAADIQVYVVGVRTDVEPTDEEPDKNKLFDVSYERTEIDPDTGNATQQHVDELVFGHRLLSARITDDEFRSIGRRVSTEVYEATACKAGTYYVKVEPNLFDLFESYPRKDDGVHYILGVFCTPRAEACAPGEDDASTDEAPRVLRTDVFEGTLAARGTGGGEERSMYSVRAAKGREVHVRLDGLDATSDVALVAAYYDQPLPLLRSVHGRRSNDGQAIELVIPMAFDRGGVAVGLRNLDTAGGSSYRLTLTTVDPTPPPALDGEAAGAPPVPPEQARCLDAGQIAQIGSDVFEFGEEDRFCVRTWWAAAWLGRRDAVVELEDPAPGTQLAWSDQPGVALGAAQDFEPARIAGTGTAAFWRSPIPAAIDGNVWVRVLGEPSAPGEDAPPSRSFDLHRWDPSFIRHGIEGDPEDPNGTPGRAETLVIDGPPQIHTMYGGPITGGDAHDWFVVQAPEDATRLRIDFRDIRVAWPDGRCDGADPADTNCRPDYGKFILSYWNACGGRHVAFPSFALLPGVDPATATPADYDYSASSVVMDIGTNAPLPAEGEVDPYACDRLAGRSLFFMIENIFRVPIEYTVVVTRLAP